MIEEIIENAGDLIWEVAKENPGGFTMTVGGEIITSGFVIAYKATQDSFGRDGLRKCVIHAFNHKGIVGGWYLEKKNELQFDSVFIETDLDTAIDKGREHDQKSIYYLNKYVELKL